MSDHFEYLFLGYYLGDAKAKYAGHDIDVALKEKVQGLNYMTLTMGTSEEGDSLNHTSPEQDVDKFLPIIKQHLRDKTFNYIYLPLFGFKHDINIIVFLLTISNWVISPTAISRTSIPWAQFSSEDPLVGNKKHWYVTEGVLKNVAAVAAPARHKYRMRRTLRL